MRKIKEVLRLHALGHSRRAMARSLGISHSTVGVYLEATDEAGLSWEIAKDLEESEIEARLFPHAPTQPAERPLPVWSEIESELRREGVTLQLLWHEYAHGKAGAYRYSHFCLLYRQWKGSLDRVLRQEHRAGEKVFVDYSGQTVPLVDPRTGEIQEAQIFVGVLGASSFTFVEATASQSSPDWIGSHVRMFEYYGGVPRVIVPDNLAAGIRHPSFYEPDLNPTYHRMACHYAATVIPARVRRPKDKAKAEAGVLLVQRWILARLRNHTFHSLAELNHEIARLREELNDRPFQKLEGSRRTRFERLDRPALQALPPVRYEYAAWKLATVHIDSHIALEKHHYSVPHSFIGKKVEARYTTRTVEIFHGGKRIAAHRAGSQQGGFTTLAEHLPKAYRKNLEWSPQRLRRWAEQTGQSTAAAVEHILSSRPHPEQGYRACLGILRLGRHYTAARLEAACARALEIRGVSYRSIESILKNGLDQQPLPAQSALVLPQDHPHVRGADYYLLPDAN